MKNSFKTYICITLFSITLWTCGSKDDTKEIILRPVKFDVVKDANSGQNKTFTGTSKTDKIINLSFRSSGIITTLDMKLGQKVKTGDLLAQLDNVQARLNYENSISALNSAESQMNTAKLNYNRIRLLYEKGSSSLSDFEAAKNSFKTAQQSFESAKRSVSIQKEQVRFGYIYATNDGVIASVQSEIDENVSPGQIVGTLNSGTDMEIALGIPENVINKITEGMLVDVSFASIENTFKAKVTEASPALDVNTATYPVRVTIVNPSDEIKSGMAANVTFHFNDAIDESKKLIAPMTAVGEDSNGNFVFLITENQNSVVVNKKPVKIGDLTPQGFEILSGLEKGQKIATAGLQTLLDGQKVKLQ